MNAYEAVQLLEKGEGEGFNDALKFAIDCLKEKAVSDAWAQTRCMHCKYYVPKTNVRGICTADSHSVRYTKKSEKRAKEQACRTFFVPAETEVIPGEVE